MKTYVHNKDEPNPILTQKRTFSIWVKPGGYLTRNEIANGMGNDCPIGIWNPNGNGFQTWTENGSLSEIPNGKHCDCGFRISNETAIAICRNHFPNRMRFSACA